MNDSWVIWRQLTACGVLAALLVGAATTRVVHVHEAANDSYHHAHEARLHSHDAGEAHHPAPLDDHGRSPRDGQDIWTVDAAISQPMATAQAPFMVSTVVASIEADPQGWLGIEPRESRAHGPPSVSPSSLRAPPISLPAQS